MRSYFTEVWDARYFWLNLASAELKYKFRRSKLGLLWTMLDPLIFMLMLTFIFGNLLNVEISEFAPFVFSGLLVWNFIQRAAVGGCNALITARSYISQNKRPNIIYPLKYNLVNTATFLIAVQGLVLWVLITNPHNFIVGVLYLPVATIFLFFLGWPVSILVSYTNLKYRDFSQIISLVMQLIWYMSPVFFEPKMFKALNLLYLVEFNPVTHILNLVRSPFILGQLPTLVDYGFIIASILVLNFFAYLMIRSNEDTLIFYI